MFFGCAHARLWNHGTEDVLEIRQEAFEKQQTIFRRRRIVFGIAVVVLVSFLVFCLYSLSRGLLR